MLNPLLRSEYKIIPYPYPDRLDRAPESPGDWRLDAQQFPDDVIGVRQRPQRRVADVIERRRRRDVTVSRAAAAVDAGGDEFLAQFVDDVRVVAEVHQSSAHHTGRRLVTAVHQFQGDVDQGQLLLVLDGFVVAAGGGGEEE